MNIATKLATASTVALLVGTVGAAANTLQLQNVSVQWLNPSPNANVTSNTSTPGDSNTNTPAEAHINWGSGGTSGYDVVADSDPVPQPGANIGDMFQIGMFTHRNQSINAGTSINSVQLSLTADVLLDGTTVIGNGLNFLFDFDHNETSNVSNCAFPDPNNSNCDDIVTVTSNNLTETFNYNNTEYTLEINGFLDEDTNQFTNQFFSAEGGNNEAIVMATFTSEIPGVPLPAAGWLLLAGVGGLAAVRRKKKTA
ncbi:VPLPA-CTERM sorting domain-containing protein [Rhodobacteraceae bacterium F11138]|nr:VPLPA-CTERM sorting domain-containing protein [Rhodobacteraceae bacterium F11138]